MKGWGQVARGDQERDELREKLLQQGRTREQIATAMARQFRDRPRTAWRHGYGWTQQEVADRFNREVNDSNASMTAHRISDFERWPIDGAGTKTTIPTLGVLAKIFSTKISKLLDRHDRQNMTNAELITCAILDSGIIPPQQLPSAISNFVGRAHELDILNGQLDCAEEDTGTVVITAIDGTAGIGKTTLALYWARTHLDQFPDGQLYVDLRGFSPSGTPVTPDTAIRGFLDAFQVPADRIPINPDDQAALYRTLVEGRRLVIVLDNARNADQVRPLLPGSPSCMVLVTSRQQLASLTARERAMHITLDFLTTEEARQLLTDFLGPERIQAEPDAVEELIQRCVRLPTALTIAAARIMAEPHTSLSTLVNQLREQRQRLDALSTGEDSQLTDIRAVFSWSYTALTPQAARLFRLLGLHPGPNINLYAAASLAGLSEQDTRQLLTRLTRAHLLKEHLPGRYQIHDLLSIYASEQATSEESEPQRQAALHRVLDYYLHSGVAADRCLAPSRDLITLPTPQLGVIPHKITDYEQAMNWFTTEHVGLLAVIDQAATCGFDAYAWQLPWTLDTFLHRQGQWQNLVARQRIAVAAAGRLGDRSAEALALRLLGDACMRLRHNTEASAYLQQALGIYQDLDDHTGQAHTHLSLSWVCERQGRYNQAITHAQRALDHHRATGNHSGQATTLNDLGWYHAHLGNYQQAITHCQESVSLFRELGDRYSEANALDSLGYAYHSFGQHNQAIIHYQQSVTLYHGLGNHYDEADVLTRLGDTHYATSDFTAARDTWQQALTIFEELGHPDADSVRAKLESTTGDQ